MTGNEPKFELCENIEHYLATLSKLYAQDNKKVYQEILVNSKIRLREGWDYDLGDPPVQIVHSSREE